MKRRRSRGERKHRDDKTGGKKTHLVFLARKEQGGTEFGGVVAGFHTRGGLCEGEDRQPCLRRAHGQWRRGQRGRLPLPRARPDPTHGQDQLQGLFQLDRGGSGGQPGRGGRPPGRPFRGLLLGDQRPERPGGHGQPGGCDQAHQWRPDRIRGSAPAPGEGQAGPERPPDRYRRDARGLDPKPQGDPAEPQPASHPRGLAGQPDRRPGPGDPGGGPRRGSGPGLDRGPGPAQRGAAPGLRLQPVPGAPAPRPGPRPCRRRGPAPGGRGTPGLSAPGVPRCRPQRRRSACLPPGRGRSPQGQCQDPAGRASQLLDLVAWLDCEDPQHLRYQARSGAATP